MSDGALYRAERDLARQSTSHHMRRERELERLLAGFIAQAQHKPHCKCDASRALRALARELDAPERHR